MHNHKVPQRSSRVWNVKAPAARVQHLVLWWAGVNEWVRGTGNYFNMTCDSTSHRVGVPDFSRCCKSRTFRLSGFAKRNARIRAERTALFFHSIPALVFLSSFTFSPFIDSISISKKSWRKEPHLAMQAGTRIGDYKKFYSRSINWTHAKNKTSRRT